MPLHSLLLGVKIGDQQGNLHFFWMRQKQMQQMQGIKEGNKKQKLSEIFIVI